MGKLTLVLGGTRSGKSRYAVELAKPHRRVAFIATCQARDREMRERVQKHRRERPPEWATFEEPLEVSSLIKKIRKDFQIVVLDCLTLLVSSFMLEGFKEDEIQKKIQQLLGVIGTSRCQYILISNEVGSGVVPANRLARKFRDIAGAVNQWVAQQADTVILMTAGLPTEIKRSSR